MDGKPVGPNSPQRTAPPNSSTTCCFVPPEKQPFSVPLHTEKHAPKHGRRRIWMASISFLSNVDSLSGSDTVTRDKLSPCKEMRRGLPWCYNSRTVGAVTEKAQHLAQIEKLLASHALHGSESLCKLLRYLANQSLDRPSRYFS